ncbi:MAG: protein kinase [Oscillospiraceae bacterium]|nr:protein kinase [Oscillospiraceae bacterium]
MVVIKEQKCETAMGAKRQRTEVDALKNIRNQYLPQVYDFFQRDNCSYTVLEFIEGQSFLEILKGNHRYSNKMKDETGSDFNGNSCKVFREPNGASYTIKDVHRWYKQLAFALDTIHNQGICHRDIKPSNIILTPTGDICLIDFNAALVQGSKYGFVSYSQGYAPPEQQKLFELVKMNAALEDIRCTAAQIDWIRADIFSLGATMEHILKKSHTRKFYTKMSIFNIFKSIQIIRTKKKILKIIKKSLNANPTHRYANGTELLHALSKMKA